APAIANTHILSNRFIIAKLLFSDPTPHPLSNTTLPRVNCICMPIEPSSATTPAAPITTIADIGKHEGQSITLRGWLYNLRASGKLLFPIFRDGTGTIQGIVPKPAAPEHVFETLKSLTLESSLVVTGKV